MIGSKLAHYEITSHLGTGGMGEVYQATDSKLGRSVAIKLLPEAFTHDADRAARFEREARVLASLNHPNIAAIYGIEESGGRKYLVMELVGGETLAEKIKRGAIPIDEALAIAKEIAAGLEAAHEKGIIHRDLKPANVKIAPDGKLKILDFGLAKAYEPETVNSNLSNSPTLSFAATQAGVILGTAAYMSPEQTRGRVVDKRTDIFAFGCVLYEMLTGVRAFEGEDVIEILGRVVTAEPNLTRLPGTTPPAIRRLLKRALKKDPRQRLGDIHDARIEIEDAGSEELTPFNVIAGPQSSTNRRPVFWIAAAAVLLLLAASLGGLLLHIYRSMPEPSITRFFIAAPDHWTLGQAYNGPLISPDGKRVAFVARNPAGKSELWVRSLDNIVAQSLPGTEGSYSPFWSPDSRSLAFFAQSKLKRIEVAGGAAQSLCDATNARGGTWNREGVILFAVSTGPLLRVTTGGGQAAAVTKLSAGQSNHRGPSFLPDGKHYLYYSVGSPETKGIYIASLDGGESRRLFDFSSVRNGKWALYEKAANGSGKEQLLYESEIGDLAPMSWSADDKYIVFQLTGARTAWDLWVLPLTGDKKAYPMMDSPFNETWAEVSPDSKWIVYNSDETGRYEIYIRPFPMGEGKWQVPANGGWYPRWRKDGKAGNELFFADAAANGKLLSMKVNLSGSTPEFSPATPLFDSGYININHGVHHKYAVSPDGQHFIVPRPESALSSESSELLPPPITVVLNWASTLNQK